MKGFFILSIVALIEAQSTPPEGYRHETTSYGGMPYQFGYSVYDPKTYNDYGHRESSDGSLVEGEYRVGLPDGRTQIVNYYVEGDSGFQAKVIYHDNLPPTTPQGPRQGPIKPLYPGHQPSVYQSSKPNLPPAPSYEEKRQNSPTEPPYPPPRPSVSKESPVDQLMMKPLYITNPIYVTDKPYTNHGVNNNKPIYYEDKPSPVVVEGKKPDPVQPPTNIYSEQQLNPPSYTTQPHDGYIIKPNPYPQTYVPDPSQIYRETPEVSKSRPHDGYLTNSYAPGDSGKPLYLKPHDGYSPKPYSQPKEEIPPLYTQKLDDATSKYFAQPHDGYTLKYYNEPQIPKVLPLPHDGYLPKLYVPPSRDYSPKLYTLPHHEVYAPPHLYTQSQLSHYTPHHSYAVQPHDGYIQKVYVQPDYYPINKPNGQPHEGYTPTIYSHRLVDEYPVRLVPHDGYIRYTPEPPRYEIEHAVVRYQPVIETNSPVPPHPEVLQSELKEATRPHSGYPDRDRSSGAVEQEISAEKIKRSNPVRIVRQKKVVRRANGKSTSSGVASSH